MDANVIVYHCIGGAFHAAAQALREQDRNWQAPELWRSELLNVLCGQMRRSGMTLADALDAAEDAELCIARSHPVQFRGALELAVSCRCTAYDLQYIALAQQLRVPLVTMDRELLRAFPDVARPLAV